MEINAEIIKIGQILSPSKFYFVSTENFEKLKIIQQNELQRLIESPHRVKNYIPQDGEVCIAYKGFNINFHDNLTTDLRILSSTIHEMVESSS